ncbi:hypothetical protein J3F84DRAFT_387583 [Trichoderma pleuroticola]
MMAQIMTKTLFPFPLFSFFFSFFFFFFSRLIMSHLGQTARAAGPHSRFTPLARQSLSHNREREKKEARRDTWLDPARAYQTASLMHRTSPTVGRGKGKKLLDGRPLILFLPLYRVHDSPAAWIGWYLEPIHPLMCWAHQVQ